MKIKRDNKVIKEFVRRGMSFEDAVYEYQDMYERIYVEKERTRQEVLEEYDLDMTFLIDFAGGDMNNIIEVRKFKRDRNIATYTLYKNSNALYTYIVDQIYYNHKGTEVRKVQEIFAGTIIQTAKQNFETKIKALQKRGYTFIEEIC